MIGITGSMGKTSTKEAVAAVLSQTKKVLYAKGGYNSEVGLPLFLLGLESPMSSSVIDWAKVLFAALPKVVRNNNYDVVILEMGVDAPGDMDVLLSLVVPDIAILTGIQAIHIGDEQFSSVEDIATEKWKLAEATAGKGGKVIINQDDPLLYNKAQTLKSYDSYGKVPSSTLCITTSISKGNSLEVGVRYQHNIEHYTIHALGDFHVQVVAPAIMVGHLLHLSYDAISKGVEHYLPPKGRGRILRGINNSIIVDSSYNAMPATVIAGVKSISTYTKGRRIAIIGQMNEQGRRSKQIHEETGLAITPYLDVLIGVYGDAKELTKGKNNIKSNIEMFFFESSEEVSNFLPTFIQALDIVYVKGSQTNVRLERVVKKLLAFPKEDSTQLVRQGSQWDKK